MFSSLPSRLGIVPEVDTSLLRCIWTELISDSQFKLLLLRTRSLRRVINSTTWPDH